MPGPVQTFEYESSPGRWRYSSAAPDEALAGIVQEYWEVEGRLSPFRERILPNGATELMVNLGPPHQIVTHAGTSVWERAWFSPGHSGKAPGVLVLEQRGRFPGGNGGIR